MPIITKRHFSRNPNGSVLTLVVLMTLLLSIVSVSLMGLGYNARMRAVRTGEEVSARVAADAGLVHAISQLNKKLSDEEIWDDTALPEQTTVYLPNSQASYNFTVTGDVGNGYLVESTGITGFMQKTVMSSLKLQGLFEYAIFADESIELKMGTTISGYNLVESDRPIKIGTNSIESRALDLKNGVCIDGDVVIGPGGDIDIVLATKMDVDISGKIYPLPGKCDLAIVNVPQELLKTRSSGTLNKGETISSNAKYDEINLRGKDQIINIEGDVILYVVGDVILSNSAQIRIGSENANPQASLTLYLGGNFMARNGAFIGNLTKNAGKMRIYGLENCGNIDFLTNGIYYGTIYAPNANVVMHNSVEIFGSVVANTFVQHVKANFHYDASLREVNINDTGVSFTVNHWKEQ